MPPKNTHGYPKKADGILRCEIVRMSFQSKSGKINNDFQEYYLRCSVADYFIKFCECKVSMEEIIAKYNPDKLINPIAVKANIVDGEWDNCDSNEKVQSRTGKYVQIVEIVQE